MRFAGLLSHVGCCLCVGCYLLGPDMLPAQDGKLDEIRQEVETPDSPDPPGPPSKDKSISFSFRGSSRCDDEDDSWNSFSGQFVFMALTSPWWLPKATLEQEDEGPAQFPPAPYTTHDGYLSIQESRSPTDGWGGRISLDSGNNFNDITSLSGRLRLDTLHRIGFDGEWVWLHERNGGGGDDLVRGDANVVIRFAQSERAQFHSGIGLNWLSGSGDPDFGFNFTYGADFFPVDPVIISTSFDLGNVNHSSLIHFRGTLGLMVLDRLHLYSGYDVINFSGNSIHSLISGIEFWF